MCAEEEREKKRGGKMARGSKGMVKVMLGGVHCSFRREVGIYQPYEIWTRVLAWDRKWLFVVSHFVEKGAVRPGSCILQPGKKGDGVGRKSQSRRDGKSERTVVGEMGTDDGVPTTSASANGQPNNAQGHVGGDIPQQQQHPAILASSIAKYVFKKGRLTIPPARILQASNLLPPEPSSSSSSSSSSSVSTASATPPATASTATTNDNDNDNDVDVTTTTTFTENNNEEAGLESNGGVAPTLAGEAVHALFESNLTPEPRNNVGESEGEGKDWTWEAMESERIGGMEVAGLMSRLDGGLGREFRGEGVGVLGRYWG